VAATVPTRWTGIDEAGYGPNLGPLVMTAVTVEAADDRPPDVWCDLASTVGRAGDQRGRLWVDDSKAVYSGGKGRARLVDACHALASECGEAGPGPIGTLGALLARLGAGTLKDVELTPWLDAGDPPFPVASDGQVGALEGGPWRIVDVRAVVVGPARFNEGLARGGSKARVHFEAFVSLLACAWERAADGAVGRVTGDKHGGRHFYYAPLAEAFPDAWIDRGVEGPELSRYTLRAPDRRLELSLRPRADATDGLVALASMVSKCVREHWMDAFNAYWQERVPGLAPTAGYPLDASRFRAAIEPLCREQGLEPEVWWRAK
jgi:hypothetical protein